MVPDEAPEAVLDVGATAGEMLDDDFSEIPDEPSEVGGEPGGDPRAFAGLLAIPDEPTAFEVHVVASSALMSPLDRAHDVEVAHEDRRVDLLSADGDPEPPAAAPRPAAPAPLIADVEEASDTPMFALAGVPDELSEEAPFSVSLGDPQAERAPEPEIASVRVASVRAPASDPVREGPASVVLPSPLSAGPSLVPLESSGIRPRARALASLRQQPPSPTERQDSPGIPPESPLPGSGDVEAHPSGVYPPVPGAQGAAESSGSPVIPPPRASLPPADERSGVRPAPLRTLADATPELRASAPPASAEPPAALRSGAERSGKRPKPVRAEAQGSEFPRPVPPASPPKSELESKFPAPVAPPAASESGVSVVPQPPSDAGAPPAHASPRTLPESRARAPATLPPWPADAVRTPVGTPRPALLPKSRRSSPPPAVWGIAVGAAAGVMLLLALSAAVALRGCSQAEIPRVVDGAAPPAGAVASAPVSAPGSVPAPDPVAASGTADAASGTAAAAAPAASAAPTSPALGSGGAATSGSRQDFAGLSWELHFSLNDVVPISASAPPAWVKSCPQLRVTGHACALGSTEVNEALGLARAEAVRSLLVDAGVDHARVTLRSVGSSVPEASDSSPAGRRRNRRAVVDCVP